MRFLAAFAAALMLTVAAEQTPALAQDGPTVAILDFDYTDSSGEPGDQDADHERRLQILRDEISRALTEAPDLEVVELDCGGEASCSAAQIAPETLLREAREAGADYLVFGSIHKMSSLIGGGRMYLLDVERDRLLMDRVLSFRGDTDEAFLRTADFASRDILRTLDPDRDADRARRDGLR